MYHVTFYDYPGYVEVDSFEFNKNLLILIGRNIPASRNPRGIYTEQGHVIYDIRRFDTLYRATDDTVIFSDDGSIYEEPLISKTINVIFEKLEDWAKPDELEVTILVNGDVTETVILNSANNWSYEILNLKPSDEVSIETDVISYADIYDISVLQLTIYVRKKEGNEPYDSIDDLYNVVVDLDDRVYALESME